MGGSRAHFLSVGMFSGRSCLVAWLLVLVVVIAWELKRFRLLLWKSEFVVINGMRVSSCV